MKSIRITTARHNTSREFINNQYLIVFNNIIMISVHQIMGPQRQDNIVLDFQMLCIRQVIDVEELFNLLHTVLCQRYGLFFFIDNIIAGFDDLFTHNGSHFRHLAAGLAPFHLPGKNIASPIKFR